eukprot:gb/GECG01011270.1/.p1 GENE.gb/GECG01011270.1/~~gb/GECG01011270.1/.p1  ORF type:complete len:705 (+),score=95.71 gb/GECG01011270.1/:1-2115(+)
MNEMGAKQGKDAHASVHDEASIHREQRRQHNQGPNSGSGNTDNPGGSSTTAKASPVVNKPGQGGSAPFQATGPGPPGGGLRIKLPGNSGSKNNKRREQQPPVQQVHSNNNEQQSQQRPRPIQNRDRGSEQEEDESQYVLPKERRNRSIVDHYELPEKEVARGHYGVVRMGKGKVDGEIYAVKSILKKKASYLPLIRNEIKILEKLQHPNIIRLVDCFEEGRTVHLVFEKCDGGELFTPIADSNFRFTERQASRVVSKMLLAIQYCHERSLVHRDLKPENVLLSDYGIDSEIKVIDFGLATAVSAGEILTHHVGTPYYIAPEVIEKQYNELCDLWSCGVITFTLMCSYPPFWDNSERGIYAKIKRGQYGFEGPEWAKRTTAVKDFIDKLLTRNPRRRLTAEAALQHPWIMYEGEASVERHDPRLLTRLRKYCAYPFLKKLVMLIAAHFFIHRTNDLSRENEMWSQFDPQGEGRITIQSLVNYLMERRRILNRPISQREIKMILEGLQIYDHENVTFMEFVAWSVPRTVYLNNERLLQAFEILDVDGDGFISVADIEKFTLNLAAGGVFSGIRRRYKLYASEFQIEPFRKYADTIVQNLNLFEGPADLNKLSLDDKPVILSTSVMECAAAANRPVWHETRHAPYQQGYIAQHGSPQKMAWYQRLWNIFGRKSRRINKKQKEKRDVGMGVDFASFMRIVCGNEADPF